VRQSASSAGRWPSPAATTTLQRVLGNNPGRGPWCESPMPPRLALLLASRPPHASASPFELCQDAERLATAPRDNQSSQPLHVVRWCSNTCRWRLVTRRSICHSSTRAGAQRIHEVPVWIGTSWRRGSLTCANQY
jgi:hypothetical protein